MRIQRLLVGVLLTVAVGACGKSNPAEPSSLTGAIVNGSIVSAGSGSSESTLASVSAASTVPPGLLVSVAGTGISARVDAAGQFTLKDVPPGLANLEFTAPGLAALLGLADLQVGQTVTIQVSLTSSSATLESARRSVGNELQVEGRVESLPPTTAAGSLVVAGQTITTDASTVFYLHGQAATFADLAIGQRVHVKGQAAGSGVLAREVKIQNTNTSTGLNLNGVMSGFSGTPAAFQFTVNGQLIKGDAATEFYGNSQFLELADGATVEVKGAQRDGFVYATRIHVNAEEMDFQGQITSKTGTVPNLTLIVGGLTVKTSISTDVKQKNLSPGLGALAVGQDVQVTGTLLPDGSVAARRIQIK